MQMVATGAHDYALAVGADVMSSIIDYTDRTTCVLFGDGAGAVVLAPAEEGEPHIIDFAGKVDGSGGDALCMPAGGSKMPASHDTVDNRLHYVKQEGATVFKFAVKNTEEIARRLLDRHGIDPSQIDLFVSHQANRRIIEAASERLGLGPDKVIINLEMYGNTTAGHDSAGARRRAAPGTREERRPRAALLGRRRIHGRRGAAALEPVRPTAA